MIPDKILTLLNERDYQPLSDEEQAIAAKTLRALEVDESSQLWQVYSKYSVHMLNNFDFTKRTEALCELVEVISYFVDENKNVVPRATDLADTHIGSATLFVREVWTVPDNLVCLTSIEGEGGYLYDILTEAIYDFDLDQLNDLTTGQLQPRWKNFWSFLEWYLQV